MNLHTSRNIGALVLLVSLGGSPLVYAGPDVQALQQYRSSAVTQADRTVDHPQCQKIPSDHLRPKSLRAWRIPEDCQKPVSDVKSKKYQHLRVKGIPIR